MKTLAIISRKGGAGKTTISLHLAVASEIQGITTAVFDLDPQASALNWADNRSDHFPAVVPAQASRLVPLLSKAKEQNAGLVILDTAPHADAIASDAATQADLVLIPCRPSSLDLNAISSSIRLARNSEKPAVVVINAAPAQGVETAEAITAIAGAGVEVCPVVLHQRKAFSSHMQQGRTANEIEPNGKAAEETRALFEFIRDRLGLLHK